MMDGHVYIEEIEPGLCEEVVSEIASRQNEQKVLCWVCLVATLCESKQYVVGRNR